MALSASHSGCTSYRPLPASSTAAMITDMVPCPHSAASAEHMPMGATADARGRSVR